MEIPNENTPNEQQINQQFNQQFNTSNPPNDLGGGTPLPNATAVLVLGIISIVACWCYGIIGLTCGIIALVLSNKSLAIYKVNPNTFTVSSYKNLTGGRICAIIGTILSGLYLIWMVVALAVLGTTVSGALGGFLQSR